MEIPFGKHHGKQVKDVPFNYLEWLTSLDLLEPLRTKVREEHDRRLHDQSQWAGPIDLRIVDEIISAGVRTLARTHHPDAGGDYERMTAINNAEDWLREKARD